MKPTREKIPKRLVKKNDEKEPKRKKKPFRRLILDEQETEEAMKRWRKYREKDGRVSPSDT